MALRKYKCNRCDKEFTAPNWKCADNVPHTIELKSYYITGEGLTVYYGQVSGDSVMNKRRGAITFVRGQFQTQDPQQQEFLDAYPGLCDFETWQLTHIPEAERARMDKDTRSRLERENAGLLAKVKELQEQAAAKTKPAA